MMTVTGMIPGEKRKAKRKGEERKEEPHHLVSFLARGNVPKANRGACRPSGRSHGPSFPSAAPLQAAAGGYSKKEPRSDTRCRCWPRRRPEPSGKRQLLPEPLSRLPSAGEAAAGCSGLDRPGQS